MDSAIPWDQIAVDLMGGLPTSENGDEYIAVVTDHFSRYSLLFALPNKEANTIALMLWKTIGMMGPPRTIRSDNGSEFVNKVVDQLCNHLNIDRTLISAYNPRANGQAERTNSTVLQMLRKMLNGIQKDWPRHLPTIQLALNSRIHASTGSTPFSLMFGRESNPFTKQDYDLKPMPTKEWKEHLQMMSSLVHPQVHQRTSAISDKRNKKFNASHRMMKELQEGSLVYIKDSKRSNKLDPLYEGPMRIVERHTNGDYRVADMSGNILNTTVPVDHIKPATEPADSSPSFEVEKIVSHRDHEGVRQYLIKWRHYPANENSWEPEKNFNGTASVAKYWSKLGY